MRSLHNRLVASLVKQLAQTDGKKIPRLLLRLSFQVAQFLHVRAAALSKVEP